MYPIHPIYPNYHEKSKGKDPITREWYRNDSNANPSAILTECHNRPRTMSGLLYDNRTLQVVTSLVVQDEIQAFHLLIFLDAEADDHIDDLQHHKRNHHRVSERCHYPNGLDP